MDYTIKELATAIGKSEQSIYKLAKKYPEFDGILRENSKFDENHYKIYNDACLEWLQDHYNIKPETASNNSTDNYTELENNINELQSKIKNYKRRIKHLKAYNEHLLQENNRLLSLLEKEQEQRQGLLISLVADKSRLMLDTPKKGFRLFKKKG